MLESSTAAAVFLPQKHGPTCVAGVIAVLPAPVREDDGRPHGSGHIAAGLVMIDKLQSMVGISWLRSTRDSNIGLGARKPLQYFIWEQS